MGNNYKTVRRNGRSVVAHVEIAEKALGKKLPQGAVVHHANKIRDDNRNENLVICPNHSYHNLIHRRMTALKECGNANWVKCGICKKYDDPKNLGMWKPNSNVLYHRQCFEEANKPKPKKVKLPTALQTQVLEFIQRFTDGNGYPPTRGEISAHFGWIHPSAAQKHINLLTKKGYLKVMPKIARGIVVVRHE